MANETWDDNQFPLAYLITIRTYGTWLHGDERQSVDRHGKNVFGTERISANADLIAKMEANARFEPFFLNAEQRSAVDNAVRSVCSTRKYVLLAVNVRSNHLHAVVTAPAKPEPIMNAFKANATRELRASGLVRLEQTIWSRGGSRRYLWKDNEVARAVDYVRYDQGED
ncbi:MAG: transposase [Acidobacteriota bacterium]